MCGICGFAGKGEREDVEKMNSALLHRGPDEQGVFFDNGIGLGHTRLSILDLSPTGHQPMFSKDHLIVTVFNGEIYNFAEIKEDLKKKKHIFSGTSDTEVILSLYEEYGEKCFEKMEGMFAIALYDRRNEKLLLARDRMGKKPLYWFLSHDTLVFASELKAFSRHPFFTKEIDLFALNKYLAYEHIPTPASIFKGVNKLEPGSYLVFENGKTRKEIFWNPNFVSEKISFKSAMHRLDEEINSAVKRRMVADVPLGIFLSGGLDSSVIAYYAQKNSRERIKTFSIGFSEKSFDESSYAREVAKFLGTEHHEKIITPKDLLAVIPHIADLVDEPLADASIIPTHLLSKFAKEYVTVALGGDGGDELFAGYPTFQADIFAGFFPKSFIAPVEKILSWLPISHTNFSVDFKIRKFLEGVRENDSHRRHMIWLGAFNEKERAMLFSKKLSNKISDAETFDDIDRYRVESKNATPETSLLYAYQRSYLMDQVMTKVDRASMFASLETRAPFLDRRVVDFVNPLPFSYKMHGFTTKYLLKKLMEGKLPKHIIYRKKKGFGLPVAKWLAEDLRDFCNSTLSESAIKKVGFFNYEYVEKLKSEHFEKQNNHAKKLWTLLVFQLWYEKTNKRNLTKIL